MAYLRFKDVRIAGISAGVPKNIVSNLDNAVNSKDYDAEAFIETTGVKERHVDHFSTTSDLCYAAAEKLIVDLGWDKSEIDGLLFVSQTPDYNIPATACILQDRLGLSKDCFAEDISLGCSGWVYGLSSAISLVSSQGLKKVLLMAGDAPQRLKIYDPLFGCAGTVTALEYKEGSPEILFNFGTDGSGFDAIIMPDGGHRNTLSEKSFVKEEIDGNLKCRLQTRMNGMDVFAFGISTAPKSVKRLAEHYGFNYLDADYFVFHQANMKMNKMIIKKLKLDVSKVPSSMYNFGNTSSASIPLTIVTQLQNKIETTKTKFICCGFGVGLSWGTVAFETENIVVSNLVEISENDDLNKEKYVI